MNDLIVELTLLVKRLDWLSLIDILLVTAIFFLILSLVRGTQAVVLLRGMLLLVVSIALLTGLLNLRAFSWVLRNALPALLVAIPVIFAPEIRRALERLGRAGRLFTPNTEPMQIERRVHQITSAVHRLAEQRSGALIVIEHETNLDEYVETGVRLDAILSSELLMQIFYLNTPLHDGAVIIRDDRVPAAACVLPLSSSGTLSRAAGRQTGLRHRAALGISEVSDSVAIVVSEETGAISVAHKGRMIRRLDQNRLGNILIAFYRPRLPREVPIWLKGLVERFSRGGDEASGDTQG